MITVINLRGTRESGLVFSIPAYGFIALMLTVIVVGLTRTPTAPPPEVLEAQARLAATGEPWYAVAGLFLILKAFSSGCAALTGIESIANGTTAFKEPVSRNASIVLMLLAVLLSTIFAGISVLASRFHAVPMEVTEPGFKTVMAQVAFSVFGNSPLYGLIQVATAAILILAANTAYAGFPRLASLVAQDGYLPRQFATLGDRLVFQNGIIVLAGAAGLLIVGFGGDTHKLVPLYAIGVFLCFTLSQFGMVLKSRRGGKTLPMIVSLVGGTVTMVITGVLAVSKWSSGAWLVPPALLVLLWFFGRVRRHYDYLASELSVQPTDTLPNLRSTVLLLVPRVHRGILQAVSYARSMTTDVRALHVTLSKDGSSKIKEDWAKFGADIPMVILESPYRSLVEPITEYIDQTLAEDPNLIVTVIVPQAVPRFWWQAMLHSNAAVPLKLAFSGRKNVVVTNIRYFLK